MRVPKIRQMYFYALRPIVDGPADGWCRCGDGMRGGSGCRGRRGDDPAELEDCSC